MKIGRKKIGNGQPPLIVAEIGINHNGDGSLAMRMAEAAAVAGADAAKLQAFRTVRLLAGGNASLSHVSGSVHEFFHQMELAPRQFDRVARACHRCGILFIATPFDEISADMLVEAGIDSFKIASGDITHFPLLSHVGAKKIPVILSTGAATIEEIRDAIRVLKQSGATDICLLHCVSAYPAPVEEMNLRAITAMGKRFRIPVGLSDHTMGITISLAAVALGAALIEKHFTLSRQLPGPDQKLSIEPGELHELTQKAREIHSAMGNGKKVPMPSEAESRRQGRRGLYLIRDIEAGEKIKATDLAVLRPAAGLSPIFIKHLRGKRARRRLQAGRPLGPNDLA